MTQRPGTRAYDRSRAPRFLDKAEHFLRGARRALEEGNRDMAALGAVHAGISACDSLTIYHLGLKSSTKRHLDVLALLRGLPFEGREHVERQLRELLSEKNEVEYEDTVLLVGDAAKMVKMAERIVAVARRVVRKP